MLRGLVADPGGRLGEVPVWGWMQLSALGVAGGSWFGGTQGLDLLVGVTAAQFGVSGDGQAPGLSGGLLPFLPVSCGLGEGVFPLLVVVAQGAVAGGQGLVPGGAAVVAVLASGGGFGVRT